MSGIKNPISNKRYCRLCSNIGAMTDTYVKLLEKLPWNRHLNNYYTTLPEGESLPISLYESVSLINHLAIIGNIVYRSLPKQHHTRQFLDYFMGIAQISEEFIWNQPGLLQCYYREGIPWQRGGLDDCSDLPILSSSVVDCLIALLMYNLSDESAILWLVAEQQNYASTSLLAKQWSYPVDTPSNPVLFVNVDSSSQDQNPHRLIFQWLALGTDILNWKRTPSKEGFTKYIEVGRSYWNKAWNQVADNYALLEKIPKQLELEWSRLETSLHQRLSPIAAPFVASLHQRLSDIFPSDLNAYMLNSSLYRESSLDLVHYLDIGEFNKQCQNDWVSHNLLSYQMAQHTLDQVFIWLKVAIQYQDHDTMYRKLMLNVASCVIQFYSKNDEELPIFWVPRVIPNRLTDTANASKTPDL